jgi:hypothetical protein
MKNSTASTPFDAARGCHRRETMHTTPMANPMTVTMAARRAILPVNVSYPAMPE